MKNLSELAELVDIGLIWFERALSAPGKKFYVSKEDARDAYRNAQNEDEKSDAYKEYQKFVLIEINQATTVEKLERMYYGDERMRSFIVEKWLGLCNTAREVRDLNYKAHDSRYGPSLQLSILLKWRKLSKAEIESAETLEELYCAHRDAMDGSEEKVAVYKRLQTLMRQHICTATTLEELKELNRFHSDFDELWYLLLRKMIEIYYDTPISVLTNQE